MAPVDEIFIVVGRLFLVHRIEVEARIIALDGLDQCSGSVLETAPTGISDPNNVLPQTYHFGSICGGLGGISSWLFSPSFTMSWARASVWLVVGGSGVSWPGEEKLPVDRVASLVIPRITVHRLVVTISTLEMPLVTGHLFGALGLKLNSTLAHNSVVALKY